MLFEAELRTSLVQLAGVAATICAALFIADVMLSVLARAGIATRTAQSLRRFSPPLVRHVAELAVTALLALGAARPAGASATPVRDWLRQSTSTSTAPTTTSAPSTSATPHPASPSPVPASRPASTENTPPAALRSATDRYVVEPGDCLWRIAARQLGHRATNQAIDSAWRAIYATNRAAVGDDPNLIHPGLVLTLPPLAAAH
jgi:nucleoid-associated protein YgaU